VSLPRPSALPTHRIPSKQHAGGRNIRLHGRCLGAVGGPAVPVPELGMEPVTYASPEILHTDWPLPSRSDLPVCRLPFAVCRLPFVVCRVYRTIDDITRVVVRGRSWGDLRLTEPYQAMTTHPPGRLLSAVRLQDAVRCILCSQYPALWIICTGPCGIIAQGESSTPQGRIERQPTPGRAREGRLINPACSPTIPAFLPRTTGIADFASSGDGARRSWNVDGGIPAMFVDAIGLIRSRAYGVGCFGGRL
jgi:hypothetical protein